MRSASVPRLTRANQGRAMRCARRSDRRPRADTRLSRVDERAADCPISGSCRRRPDDRHPPLSLECAAGSVALCLRPGLGSLPSHRIGSVSVAPNWIGFCPPGTAPTGLTTAQGWSGGSNPEIARAFKPPFADRRRPATADRCRRLPSSPICPRASGFPCCRRDTTCHSAGTPIFHESSRMHRRWTVKPPGMPAIAFSSSETASRITSRFCTFLSTIFMRAFAVPCQPCARGRLLFVSRPAPFQVFGARRPAALCFPPREAGRAPPGAIDSRDGRRR